MGTWATRSTIWLVAGFALTACSSARAGSSSGPEAAQGSRATEISAEEISERGGGDLSVMQLVQNRRPSWLRPRGQRSVRFESTRSPVVYVDDVLRGGISTLSEVSTNEVLRVEFVDAWAATTRWGTGHAGGVIHIVTIRE